jgi:hypothetical protein
MTDDWMASGLCAGAGVFGDTSPDGIATALAVCNGKPGQPACPVRARCHRWASTAPLLDGVAGGRYFVNGKQKRPPQPVKVRQVVTTDDDLRAGHAAWVRGERSPELEETERQYQRLRYLARRRAA